MYDKTTQEMIEYIEHILLDLRVDYNHLRARGAELLREKSLTPEQKSMVEWTMMHTVNSMTECERKLEQYKKVLKDAN